MSETDYRFWVGIDWADRSHQVAVLSGGEVIGERVFEHTGAGLSALADWLVELSEGAPQSVAVAIELTRGTVIDTLLEREVHVYGLNPKQLDRFRDRHTMAGAKDDRLDAFVLASSLRTDLVLFRRLEPESPEVLELRELSRIDAELGTELVRYENRLREQLRRYYPQALELVPSADSPWLWDVLELVPTPAAANKVTARELDRVLKTTRMRRFTAREVLKTLRQKPVRLVPGAVEAAAGHVGFLLPQLKLLHQQRSESLKRIKALLGKLQEAQGGDEREHRDVEILLSVTGIGSRVAATMLSEANGPLEARDYHRLRALSAAAPVTRQSGKGRRVCMRYGCNGRLRDAVFHWARVAVQKDERCRAHYRRLRAKGHRHGRALRGVADRLLKMLVAMLSSGSLYDPTRRAPLEVSV